MDIATLRAQKKKIVEELHPLPPNDPPPVYSGTDFEDRAIKYNCVGDGWLARLNTHLSDTDVDLLLDDSGSMFFNNISQKVRKQYMENEFRRPDGKCIVTRFDEALTSIYRLLPLIQTVGAKVTLSFLNSKDKHTAETDDEYALLMETIVKLCKKTSGGGTPLVARARNIYNATSNRKHLAIMFIDGEPGDYGFEPQQVKRAKADLVEVFRHRAANRFTCIALCTDNEAEVGIYNGLDTELARFDVCDDFFSERIEVVKVYQKHGVSVDERMFTYEDYLVKMLIGSIDREIDGLDELIDDLPPKYSGLQ